MSEKTFSDVKAQISWGYLGALCGIGILMSAYFLFSTLPTHSWTLPKKEEIQIARGSFLSINQRGAYVFRSTDGRTINLGCLPESISMGCLSFSAIEPSLKLGKIFSIQYFYVLNKIKPSLSNVLLEVKTGSGEIVTYQSRLNEIEKWSNREDAFNWSLRSWIANLLPAVLSIVIAAMTFFANLNQLRKQT